MAPLINGGCLCGAVRYRLSAAPMAVANCHCSMCRKHSGAAFLTYALVARGTFELLSGRLVPYRSSPAAVRSHCGVCGSPLAFAFDADPEGLWLTIGSFDTPNALVPGQDWFTDDALTWVTRNHDLRAWPGAPTD